MAGSWSQIISPLQLEISPADVPTLRFVRGREQAVSRDGSSSPIVVRATDRFGQPAANEASSATALAGSSPGTYKVRALSNGRSVETLVYTSRFSSLASTGFSGVAEPNVVGISVNPNPAGSSWTVEGLPSWIRTPTPSGTGRSTIWLSTNINTSLTDFRGASFTIGVVPVQISQAAGSPPSASMPKLSSTSGSAGTFQAFYGAANCLYLNVLNSFVRDSIDGRSASYVAFSVLFNKLYLVEDGGPDSLLSPITIPSAESASNSQCSVLGMESSPPDLVITFASGFSGSKLVYAGLSDVSGRASGWTIVRTHLSFLFEDQTNARNLETAWILSRDARDGRRACSIAYHRPSQKLFLIPDSGVGAEASSLPLCGTVVNQTWNRLTLTLPTSFRTGRSEQTRAIWTAVQTLTGQRSNWQALGTVRKCF